MDNLDNKTVKQLREICKTKLLKNYSRLKKNELLYLLKDTTEDIIEEFNNLSIDNNKYNVLDLFCGCGGFTNGFKKIFNIVCGIDNWDVAIKSYKANNNHISLCKDLTKYTPENLKLDYIKDTSIDIIIGGPPCQAFSSGGKRCPDDDRAGMYIHFYNYIKYFKPKIFVMENVMGILSVKDKNGDKLINRIITLFEELYTCKIHTLYACDFDVPQLRRRVIIIGTIKNMNYLNGDIKLVSNKKRPTIKNILEPKESIDLKYYLSEKALTGIKIKKERMLKEGKGFGAQFLDINKPSYTIPARYWKDGYDALVKYSDNEIRRLTILELKRIQTFEDDYILYGSKKDQIIQIGNAVATNFAYYIAKHVLNILQSEDDPKN